MTKYTLEECFEVFKACSTLHAKAPTSLERRHWDRQRGQWRERMIEARSQADKTP